MAQADATDLDAVRGVAGDRVDLGVVSIGTDFEDSVLAVAVF